MSERSPGSVVLAVMLSGIVVLPITVRAAQDIGGLSTDQALVFSMANTLGVIILVTSTWFKFRVVPEIEDHLILPFPILAAVLFFFAAGGKNYAWPFPGAIWQVGLTLLAFVAGYGLRAALSLAGTTKTDHNR